MEDEEFSMYENRFGSRDLSLQAAAAAESLNSTSFLDQIDDGIGELRAHPEQLERNPSSSRVFDVDKTGLGVRAAYVHPSSASSSLIDQSDDDMGGRQSTTLWNADNPSSSRVFDVDKTGLGARAAHIHLSSTRSSAAIHGMEEDDSEEKDEENEGGRGGDQGSVFLDDLGKYFYHRPLESCNEDLSMFLLGRNCSTLGKKHETACIRTNPDHPSRSETEPRVGGFRETEVCAISRLDLLTTPAVHSSSPLLPFSTPAETTRSRQNSSPL